MAGIDRVTHIQGLAERVVLRDRAAIGRAITLIENDSAEGAECHRLLQQHRGKGLVIGITGPPGAGKSTLIGAYINLLRRENKTVAVIAIDPSSPLTGGAILGDRIRMSDHAADDGVFIRSVASRGHVGGLSATVHGVIQVMEAAGYDVVIVETVGAGQSETEVAQIADIKVVVMAPGLGDHVQAIKAGILEIADILVVNKADSPLADQAALELRDMLKLRRESARAVAVVKTKAISAEGLDELAGAIQHIAGRLAAGGKAARDRDRARAMLAWAAAELVRGELINSRSQTVVDLCEAVTLGKQSLSSAAAALVSPLLERLR
ncbi:MAG: methylmalonyl Co-A mutase-associated GTPase MeaB [Burkholderiales bacterium]